MGKKEKGPLINDQGVINVDAIDTGNGIANMVLKDLAKNANANETDLNDDGKRDFGQILAAIVKLVPKLLSAGPVLLELFQSIDWDLVSDKLQQFISIVAIADKKAQAEQSTNKLIAHCKDASKDIA